MNSSNLSELKIIEAANHCALCGALPNRLIDDKPKLGYFYCTRCYRHYPKNEKFRAIMLNENPIKCLKCRSINLIQDTKYKSEINDVDYVVITIFCLDCKERMVFCLLYDRIFSRVALNAQVIRHIDPCSGYPFRKKAKEQTGIKEESLRSRIENPEINDLPKQPKISKMKTEMSVPHNYTFFENQHKDIKELIGLFSNKEDENYYLLSLLIHDILNIRKQIKSLHVELQDSFKEFMKTTENLEKRAEDGDTYADKILNVVHDRAINTKIMLIDLFNYTNWSITMAFETWRRSEKAGIIVDNEKRNNKLKHLSEMCYKLLELLKIISNQPSLWTIFHGSTQLTSEYESFKVLQDNVFSFKMKNKLVKEFNRFYITAIDKLEKLEFKMKKLRTLLETYELEEVSYEKTNVSKTQKIVSFKYLIEQLQEKNDNLFLLIKDV